MHSLFDEPFQPREIDLRPYQEGAISSMRAEMAAGARKIVLASPTGSGKTEIGMSIIMKNQLKGSTAWFIVDRVTLIDQTSERFFAHGIDHGIIQGDNRLTDYSKPVQIASAQTLARRSIRKLPDLILWDEAHCEYKSVLALIEEASEARVIGLTATPFTSGMANHWDGVVNVTTVNKLLAGGYLSPLKIKACVSPDMKGAKKKGGEYEEEEAGQRGIIIIGDVVRTWIEQTAVHFGGPVKTIVFSPSVKHGEELCRQFAEAGFNFQQISYHDKSDDDRKEKIREFRKPGSAIHGLVSCAVLTKGFDAPDVLCGISCRPYAKSFSSHIQEMGRVMRTYPGKEFGLWLDHSGNCISFAEDTAWLYEYGVDSLSTAQKKDSEPREPSEKEKAKHFCGCCGLQLAPAAISCAACGWERPTASTIQFVQGELVDLDLSANVAFKPRIGLRAECLKNPKAVWNAALSHCLTASRGGEDAARKWAYGIWRGIYPDSKLPNGLFEDPAYKRKGKQKFIMIDGYVKRSEAWKTLTPVERCAYIEVKWRYDGTNNGRIGLGCRELADDLGMGRDTANRALDALVEKGFIVKAKASAFNVKNRAVTEWRLTEYACDVTGELPSKEFMRWLPAKKTQSHPSDTQSHPSDTPPVKATRNDLHSRAHRTVRPDFAKTQSHPSDTYRYTIGGKPDVA